MERTKREQNNLNLDRIARIVYLLYSYNCPFDASNWITKSHHHKNKIKFAFECSTFFCNNFLWFCEFCNSDVWWINIIIIIIINSFKLPHKVITFMCIMMKSGVFFSGSWATRSSIHYASSFACYSSFSRFNHFYGCCKLKGDICVRTK